MYNKWMLGKKIREGSSRKHLRTDMEMSKGKSFKGIQRTLSRAEARGGKSALDPGITF